MITSDKSAEIFRQNKVTKPTWYLQHLHPVKQGRGNGRCSVCCSDEEHLWEVKGHIQVMVCEAVVLLWVQDLSVHTETLLFCVCVCVFCKLCKLQ